MTRRRLSVGDVEPGEIHPEVEPVLLSLRERLQVRLLAARAAPHNA